MMRAVFVVALVVLLAACNRPDDEARVRQHLETMSAALAEADRRAFMGPLAEDFTAETWNLDRAGVRLLLAREFRRHDRIRARLFDIDVDLFDDGRATATFQVVLTSGSGLLPEQGSWYRVTTGWRRGTADWELISARWERVAGR